MARSSAGTLLPGRRRYAATDTLRRPRGAIPRLAPTRLLSGLTSFWPDCRRDFNSAFARRFEFRFAIQKQYSRSLPSGQRLWRWCHRLVWTAFRYRPWLWSFGHRSGLSQDSDAFSGVVYRWILRQPLNPDLQGRPDGLCHREPPFELSWAARSRRHLVYQLESDMIARCFGQ
jgi:hypothetical protein